MGEILAPMIRASTDANPMPDRRSGVSGAGSGAIAVSGSPAISLKGHG